MTPWRYLSRPRSDPSAVAPGREAGGANVCCEEDRQTHALGHKPPVASNSQFLAQRSGERQVCGDHSEGLAGSARPIADTRDWQLNGTRTSPHARMGDPVGQAAPSKCSAVNSNRTGSAGRSKIRTAIRPSLQQASARFRQTPRTGTRTWIGGRPWSETSGNPVPAAAVCEWPVVQRPRSPSRPKRAPRRHVPAGAVGSPTRHA